MDAPTQSIYPHSATLFAAISACVFATIGVFGKFSTQTHPLAYPKHHTIHTIYYYEYCRQSDYAASATEKSDDTRTCDDRVRHIAQYIGSALLLLQPAPDCRAFLSGGAYGSNSYTNLSTYLYVSFFLSLSSPQSWTFGSTLCKIFPVIFYGNVAVSLLSMVGITLNR